MTNKAKDILKWDIINFMNTSLLLKISWELNSSNEARIGRKTCNLFMDIQQPYSRHCPIRVNFWLYMFYKMCELLDEKKFLPYFPMLKDPLKN